VVRGRANYLRVAAFVAVWMCVGWLFKLSGDAYLLVGNPLLWLFQTFVRRKPIRALWVRDSERFHLHSRGIAAAIALMVVPACGLPLTISDREWTRCIFLAATCVGAIGAGFSLQYVRLTLSSRALVPFALAVLVGTTTMAIPALLDGRSPWLHLSQVPSFLLSFTTYVPVCFALEEVAFRGALDTDVWIPDSSRRQAWLSALFVSSLWGLWHLPTLDEHNALSLLGAAPILILTHAVDGAFIAFSWRASGSLLLPAVYHSVVDAYRDTIWA
jgi:membrane protease YdiL (CAAX protease family)